MNISARSVFVVALTLLVALGLSSCGSSGNSVPFASSSASFAYLLDNSSNSDLARNHSHPALSHSHAALKARPHNSHPRAKTSTGVDIGTGSIDVHIYDTSKGTDTQLTGSGTPLNQSYAFYNAQLSNDGTKLLLVAENTEGYGQIYIADAKLQTITQLTGLTGSDVTSYHINAALSADGKTVAFDDWDGNLYTMPASGGTPTLVSLATLYGATPAFTPDGKSLVFTGWVKEEAANVQVAYDLIYSVNLSTGATQQLSMGTDFDAYPTVSADGTHVAFQRYQETNDIWGSNVAVVGITGESTSNPATIVTTDNMSWQPVYLGSKILYASDKVNDPGTYADNIYLMNGDGSGVTRITNTTLETCFNWWAWNWGIDD
jgi:Tol biopolymer transport system component